MIKKIFILFVTTILAAFVFNSNKIKLNAAGNQFVFEDLNVVGGGGGSGNYYSYISSTSRMLDPTSYTPPSSPVDSVTFGRYRPPWHRNYHIVRAYEEGYKDVHVTSKIMGAYAQGGFEAQVTEGTTISRTFATTISIAPEIKGIKLGGYSETNSWTVSRSESVTFKFKTLPNSPTGFYGIYSVNARTRYKMVHRYSKSNQNYDLLMAEYKNVFMYYSTKPDIAFIYSGGAPLL